MKVGIVIPDRRDRPRFIQNCLRMIGAQTLKPAAVALMNEQPRSEDPDITWRYRRGYNKLRNQGLDVIAFMENDDYYAPDYLEIMTREWDAAGRPHLFGTSYTIYYHIRLFEYFTMEHHTRSSAMSTLIQPDLDFPWCSDHEAFTDTYLWGLREHLRGQVFIPPKHICLGIKHGVGKTGGRSHTERLDMYKTRGTADHEKTFLRHNTDTESFKFYAGYFANANII